VSLVAAADGGNSKTELVLAATDGTVLSRVVGAGTRPLADGLAATVDGLVSLLHRAFERAGRPVELPLAAAAFSLANVDLPDEHAAMHAAITARGITGALDVENDTLAVLRAGSPEGWGIGIVCGAGVNAVGRTRAGRLEPFLGLGGITGDWGGGWALATAAIGAAVRAGDGRGPATLLRELVEAEFGAPAEDVAVASHREEIPGRRLMTFAPVVLAAAARGDEVAVGIVGRLSAEVVDYVRALVGRLGEPTDGLPVVLGGGVLQTANPVLMAQIGAGVAEVAPGAVLTVLDVPPVAGALASALELAGAGRAAIERARTALRPVPTPART
jgi:N-acetylglucosamine kinase-like BadF-type ATPase